MIAKESYTKEHIEELARGTRADRQILERSIFALGLLEALVRVGTPMRFKGGSSLLLLLDKPMRLSTDVDVVVPPGTNIDHYLEAAARIFPFLSKEEQVRKGRNGIIKRHFKFYYNSPVSGGPFHIFLDVLFESDHYARTAALPIANGLLVQDGPVIKIDMPTADCILGDKLTAFAPHTTGIPLNIGKDLEVIKQMYDVATLVDVSSDFWDTRRTFEATVLSEIGYRGVDVGPSDVLRDSIEAAVCIAGRGRYGSEYQLYLGGIRKIANHIFGEHFTAERAVRSACKTMYVAASVLAGAEKLEPVDDPSIYIAENIGASQYAKLSQIRKLDPLAFAYACRAIKLLGE